MAPFLGTLYKKICPPALFFFVLSMIGFFYLLIQNLANLGVYKFGQYSILVPSLAIIYICKLVYIFFWTYVLNLICKDGNTLLSWVLVLLPWVLVFCIINIILFNTYGI
jgi:hypothetical protein